MSTEKRIAWQTITGKINGNCEYCNTPLETPYKLEIPSPFKGALTELFEEILKRAENKQCYCQKPV